VAAHVLRNRRVPLNHTLVEVKCRLQTEAAVCAVMSRNPREFKMADSYETPTIHDRPARCLEVKESAHTPSSVLKLRANQTTNHVSL